MKKETLNHPELFLYHPVTGETKPCYPHESALASYSRDLQKHTALDDKSSEECVLAATIAALNGSPLLIGGHITWCSALYLLAAYNSAVRLLLDYLEQIFWTIREVGMGNAPSSFEDVFAQPVQAWDRVIVGSAGPFRAFTPKALPAVNHVASAIRGHHGEQGPRLTIFWAADANEVILAAQAGRSVGMLSLMTCLRIDVLADTLPVALSHISELKLARRLVASASDIAERRQRGFTFSKDAENLMTAAVQGRPFWGDDLRKIGSRAAAEHFLANSPAPQQIDAATTICAIEKWRENEATTGALLGTGSAQAARSATADDLAAKASRIFDYCMRLDVTEMSPRDAVLHGFGKTVPEAMLQLVWLETKGLAKQVRFVQNGRALQKWALNTQQSPPPSEDGNTEESGGNLPAAPLTSPVEGEAP